jgi:hypothetical protein
MTQAAGIALALEEVTVDHLQVDDAPADRPTINASKPSTTRKRQG